MLSFECNSFIAKFEVVGFWNLKEIPEYEGAELTLIDVFVNFTSM